MIISKEGHTSIVAQERGTLIQFLGKLRESYPSLKEDHIILNLFSFTTLKAADLLEFLHLSNTHRAAKKSFVLVSNAVSYDEVPDEICLVPTIQEAKDIIEMEEIERDLDL